MDYKRIFRDQKIRFKILNKLSWVPDPVMLRLQYRIKNGFWPNFRHPQRFTEKIQLYKMKYRNPVMFQCVDKYEVRKYVESKGLGKILNELYGVYDSPDEINFNSLPQRFVIKTTDGGGGLKVIVVKDKQTTDLSAIQQKLNQWGAGKEFGKRTNVGREWAYTGIRKRRIIIEKYLQDTIIDNTQIAQIDKVGLTDYKLFCFNGEPKYMYVIPNRSLGEYATLGVYDMQFNKLPVYRCDEHRSEEKIAKPHGFEEMIDVARKLSSDFPHVRVDLYDVDGKVYFGELTFYDGSGYYHYDPDSFDFEAGSYFTEYK